MDAAAVLKIFRDSAADIERACAELRELAGIPQEFSDGEEKRLRERLSLLTAFRWEVNAALDRLEPKQLKMIELRFFERRRWAYIEASAFYSMRQAQYIYRQGMERLGQELGESDIVRAVIAFGLIR